MGFVSDKIRLSEGFKYRLIVNYPFLDWLRRALSLKNISSRLRTKRRIRTAIESGQPLYLNVGCARTRIPGWLHGDIIHGEIYLDARRRMPFPDRSVDIIYSEHFIEHISLEHAIRFIRESFRILKPGGMIRHSTPDLEFYAKLYLGQVSGVDLDAFYARARHIRPCAPEKAVFMNEILRMYGHQFIYDYDFLSSLCAKAGFVKITRSKYGQSDNPALVGLESHSKLDWFRYEATFVLEATK